MTNPFKNNDKAFLPMYSDIVVIISERQNGVIEQKSLSSAVFPIQQVDPFADSEIDSEIKMVHVNVRKKDWTFSKPMQIGDIVKLEDNTSWKISSVDLFDDSYDIVARSIG